MVGLAAGEDQCGCGRTTVRVTPRATTKPCVYWPGDGGPLSALLNSGDGIVNTAPFYAARIVPEVCETCEFRDICRGGCAGRRMLQGRIDEPDYYCPIVRGDRPRLGIRMAPARDLPKLGSACTTVVIARN
jgi:radical SAM protein with 4Fe4S-binding SPASM domain